MSFFKTVNPSLTKPFRSAYTRRFLVAYRDKLILIRCQVGSDSSDGGGSGQVKL